MDSAVERQKSQPRTSHLSLIHYFTMLWKVGSIPIGPCLSPVKSGPGITFGQSANRQFAPMN
jgi:hypothetical protein